MDFNHLLTFFRSSKALITSIFLPVRDVNCPLTAQLSKSVPKVMMPLQSTQVILQLVQGTNPHLIIPFGH